MELTEKEFKDLVIGVAIKIAPMIIEKGKPSDATANVVALYSHHIAEAVNDILKDPSGNSL